MSNWTCPRCKNELGELNALCEYCKVEGVTIFNPDKYFVRDIRLFHIDRGVIMSEEQEKTQEEFEAEIDANERMTPQEKLYAKLFFDEKIVIRDMSNLELDAHIEELSSIAFDASARTRSAKAERDRRIKKKQEPTGPTGFIHSLNPDDASSQAINTIKERQKRQSKIQKIQEGLINMYMSAGLSKAEAIAEAEKATTAAAILKRLKDKENDKSKDIVLGNETRSPLSQENGFVIQKSKEEIEKTEKPKIVIPFINPFAKLTEKK